MTYVLIAVAVMAIVTYIPRFLPLTFMRRKIQNRFIKSF
ncbi:MAG: AzlD domain-containing protein, partial [Peptococcaceae bacterium]|nr:AzlD domain-containing protein [Peptococcaceae bacterium]